MELEKEGCLNSTVQTGKDLQRQKPAAQWWKQAPVVGVQNGQSDLRHKVYLGDMRQKCVRWQNNFGDSTTAKCTMQDSKHSSMTVVVGLLCRGTFQHV